MKILSIFTHPHGVPNLYALLKNIVNQTTLEPIDFHCIWTKNTDIFL